MIFLPSLLHLGLISLTIHIALSIIMLSLLALLFSLLLSGSLLLLSLHGKNLTGLALFIARFGNLHLLLSFSALRILSSHQFHSQVQRQLSKSPLLNEHQCQLFQISGLSSQKLLPTNHHSYGLYL